MPDTSPLSRTIVDLADAIVADIRDRGLAVGDEYHSLQATARMLRTRNSQVSSALRLLEHRGIFDRKQRKGTFVSRVPDASPGHSVSRIQNLHLVVERNFVEKEGALANNLLVGMQSQAPHAKITLDIPPAHRSADFYEKLVRAVLASDTADGFVLMSAPSIAQRIFADSGLPAAIGGTPFPSIDNLPWCDGDQAQAAVLATHYLLERGHRQFMVLMSDEYRPGDYVFWDGLRNELDAAGIRLADVVLRSLPNDDRIAQAEIAKHLLGGMEQPGILARSLPLAQAAANAIEQVHPARGRRAKTAWYPSIVTKAYYSDNGGALPFASVRLDCTAFERGQWLVQALENSPHKTKGEAPHRLIPFQFFAAQKVVDKQSA